VERKERKQREQRQREENKREVDGKGGKWRDREGTC
jgi:hypothetical protein